METFVSNLKQILQGLDFASTPDIATSRRVIAELNRFLYTNHEGIGTTLELGSEYEFLSDFHIFWKANYREILNPTIDDKKCGIVADGLHEVFLLSPESFLELYDTCGLDKEDICRVRYFGAAQDFRGSRNFSKLAEAYKSDPSVFSVQHIHDNPEDFLKEIGVTKLSQSDKRVNFAKRDAEFLIERGIEPFEMLECFNNDLVKLRAALINTAGMGFGNKKADMFLRDMAVHKVWTNYVGFDKLDVASDVNTMKVALRTGILKTEIPLVSSLLDIFCYQYVYMDRMNAKAWRRVWEIWAQRYPKECVTSPCLIDYFVYRVIGRECCDSKLSVFKGEECGHMFYWHSPKNKTCQTCFAESGIRKPARQIDKVYPCTCDGESTYYQAVVAKKFPSLNDLKGCPFKNACKPRDDKFVMLQPPKSISILGRTGWTTAYSREGEGGGGLQA